MASEADLIPHYNKHLTYYSPLRLVSVAEVCGLLGVPLVGPVLDLGCGTGIAARQLPPDMEYVGVDYAEERIRLARREQPGRAFLNYEVRTFLELGDQLWGTILAFELFEHLEDPAAVVDLALSKLDGCMVGSVPKSMPYEAHLSVFDSPGEVIDMLSPDVLLEHVGHFWMGWQAS